MINTKDFKNNIEFLEGYAEELKDQIKDARKIGADQVVIIKENNLKVVLELIKNLKK